MCVYSLFSVLWVQVKARAPSFEIVKSSSFQGAGGGGGGVRARAAMWENRGNGDKSDRQCGGAPFRGLQELLGLDALANAMCVGGRND